ncbi:MAG: thioredoxin-dependent thiol peroxidase [Rickettsiales bacterium]|nr:thioredoxin-dependent thiol peroxidase [Pseudomonadota bacterium]MDA0966237.1 thioredoxin-dependent thiol peroxidase [Pseudomonadota bacterium]MDG4543098.1 thioredoxin-dependent thiol peroxidase [Rickettsiales bacterium]MDG4545296.1 thioredoxin-dependent thiol peroxidase [Rickettsiales bacterium]MDG4547745.1 thioredoxin-dependent thiol peroxidase [Rickettsiales bacterium]
MNTAGQGEKAPDFTLKSDKFDEVTLSKQKNKNIVLYFYPKDNTPGCTQQAIDFTEKLEEFSKNDTIIFGVSKDDPQTHEHFKSMKSLKITLLSDENLDVIPKYGSWIEKNMYGKKYMGIDRSTFLIDKEGIVRQVWRKVKVKGHVEEVLEEVKKING